MATRTFKIGESCQGGVITAEIKGNNIIVIGKEWDYSKGSKKSSDQSNAKEFTRKTVVSDDSNAYRELFFFLTDLTTSYYADEVMKWISSKKPIKNMW